MNSFINTLSDTVLFKGFEAFDVEALKMLCEKHPYSSAIQLLYTRKLKEVDSEAYQAQLQKTLLYYSNPLFIKYLIEAEDRSIEPTINHKLLSTEPDDAPSAAVVEAIENNQGIDATIISSVNDPVELTNPPEIVEQPDNAPAGEQNIKPEKSVLFKEALSDDVDENDAEPVTDETEEDDALLPLPQFKFEPIDPAKAELAFMPYHTVDYFAAQGIKLGDDNRSTDRFGTQLKSFTSWLKQMKRLPGATAKGNITLSEEKSIEQMAEQSIKGENADTEAMAQVWAKQGHSKKAIEIYKKLSLQIPAKSAYFAAKIDHLKKQT